MRPNVGVTDLADICCFNAVMCGRGLMAIWWKTNMSDNKTMSPLATNNNVRPTWTILSQCNVISRPKFQPFFYN